MSLELIKDIFSSMPACEQWHAHILRFTHSKKRGTTYNCRRIKLKPSGKIDALILEISEGYVRGTNNLLSKYTDVREYDGTCNGTTIYRISENNTDISIDINALLQGVAESDSESEPLEGKAQGYIICGTMMKGDEEHQIKLISMNTPITTLKNRFLYDKGAFWEMPDKVLNLRTMMNVVIYDKTVYLLDMSGENLFNMERAYKLRCNEVVKEIASIDIVSNFEVFQETAKTGHNPRRFAAFSNTKLQLLTQEENREKVAESFGIPLTEDKEQFITNEKADAEKLVKVLCGKAMWDILEDVAVEVDSSKSWES